ncbi:hypothetical protein [Pseudochelatococcus sp. G4_1912]|uniref:hypothetical protein n=1 Tax=Pseudochelatococcus sp. G4_1912 TaxID=3114288 RepID=UPI0039C62479
MPETGAAAALAIFSLFPTFGYFSMRFGTVNAVMFFSMLSFYFAWNDKPSTERGRLLALLSLAFAGAIKLSGLLIAPLIGGLILVHLSDRSLVGVIRAMLVPSLVFLLALVVFTNPAFLYVPFDEGILTSYVLTLKTFLEIAKRSPEALSPGMLFYHGIFGTAVSAIAICILSIGIFIAGIKEKALRAEIFVLLVSIALIFSYIVLSIHSRASVGSYATAISFLLILGAIGWSRLRIGIGVLTLIALLMAGDAALRAQVPHAPRPDRWGHFSYFDKMQQMDAVLESATFINACIVDLAGKQWGGHLFTDYTLSLTVNNLTNPNVCFSTAWYNLSPSGKYCDRPLDYLVMDKLAPGALPSLKFEKYISQVDEKIAANLRMDRASREGIERDGSFNGQHFEVVCETARLKVFKAAK